MPLQITRNDITKMKVDALVNSANPKVSALEGVDYAIYMAAGMDELLAARGDIGVIQPGEAAITSAFLLTAKYIIHTVGPIWRNGTCQEFEVLESCYEMSLKLAKENNCRSIAFPLISTGTYGFPKDKALQIAISTISRFLLHNDMNVFLVVYDKKSYELSGKLFHDVAEFIDDHYVDKRKKDNTRRSPDRRSALSDLGYREEMEDFFPYTETKYQLKYSEDPMPLRSQRRLNDIVDEVGETFQERLLRLIDERELTDVEVYKRANLDRKLFSKIRCKTDYQPKKKTALALAISLRLNLDETIDLLSRAGMALSPSSKFDLILRYFIENEVYDINTINMALFQHDQPILGE